MIGPADWVEEKLEALVLAWNVGIPRFDIEYLTLRKTLPNG